MYKLHSSYLSPQLAVTLLASSNNKKHTHDLNRDTTHTSEIHAIQSLSLEKGFKARAKQVDREIVPCRIHAKCPQRRNADAALQERIYAPLVGVRWALVIYVLHLERDELARIQM